MQLFIISSIFVDFNGALNSIRSCVFFYVLQWPKYLISFFCNAGEIK